MIFLKIIIISYFKTYLLRAEFVKYVSEKNLGIKKEFIDPNKLAQKAVSDQIFCLLACNQNPACQLVILSGTECTLFNNQISLLHTSNSTNTTIFNKKKKLNMCIEGKAYDKENKICYPMRYLGESCAAAIECVTESASCSNAICQCFENQYCFYKIMISFISF